MMGGNRHSAEDIKKGIRVNNHASGYPKGHYYSRTAVVEIPASGS